ncbi:MAG: hypothetical protein KKB90_07590 [Actinobacteria bacterium]|nr:hypothetical protein [Actinomycetota bacterium]MBU4391094.1 hypothetical protein [Actinomycetota bacterium]MBU4402689.1 hypothetical protein [Actinomycetota bacterium]MBU4440902.1 hypothetical protein [Actinomycetota bacterium]MCG2817555.1 hypothetical protein [Actinomycetes bacterium]
MMKKIVSGIVQNISTNPFQTFSRKKGRNSKLLSFDISFDLCDDDGEMTHVWFNRSFRLPPTLENGDFIEVHGKYGRFFRRVGKNNFYATKIVDKAREREYSAWRNKEITAGNG